MTADDVPGGTDRNRNRNRSRSARRPGADVRRRRTAQAAASARARPTRAQKAEAKARAKAARQRERVRRRRAAGRRTAEQVALLGIVVTLNLVGLVMVMSASSVVSLEAHDTSWYYFKRQAIWALVGTVVMLVTQRIDYHRWARWAGPALWASIALLAAVLVPGVGVNANGATRWLGYGPVIIQPSEVAKLGLVLFCAALLGRRIHQVHRSAITLRPVLVVSALVIVLVMAQPNLGTSIVLAAIVLTVLFVAGMPMRPLGAIAGVGVALATAGALIAPYRRARVLAFLHPEADPQGSGYQTMQAWMAMAEGGVSGVGVGASRAKWGFLPFAHTDFIFAIIAEEFGFLGAAVVIMLFVALAAVGIRTAFRAPDAFGMLLAAGVTAWFVVQAFVNIGAVVGVLPITGVPLPFVSSGGSSLVTSMAACGLLLNVARQLRAPKVAAATHGDEQAAPARQSSRTKDDAADASEGGDLRTARSRPPRPRSPAGV